MGHDGLTQTEEADGLIGKTRSVVGTTSRVPGDYLNFGRLIEPIYAFGPARSLTRSPAGKAWTFSPGPFRSKK